MTWTDTLPAIGSFLAGPAGGLAGSAVQWLAERFGASEKTVEGIRQALSGMTPDQLLEARRIDIEFQKFCRDNGIRIQLAQIEVNREEAKSASLFVSGWRPACGWVGATALAYAALVEPVLRFVAQVVFEYGGSFPVLDTTITMQVLFGLLGLGALRSVEKVKGSEGNR